MIYKNMSDPPTRMAGYTPHNTNLLPSGVRGVMVGTAGNVAFEFADGSTHTVALQANVYYGIVFPRRILSTGTTAQNITLLF